jgi:hypothetical protein
MADEIVLKKGANNTLHPATDYDADIMRGWKVGQAKKIKAVNVSPRVLKYHQRYWAGLIPLTLQYWEPGHLLTSSAERKTMRAIVDWYKAQGFDAGPLTDVFTAYESAVTAKRRASIDIPEAGEDQLHRWIKEQTGYYDIERTPDGLVKRLHSINFASMDQQAFEKFYDAAFRVCWVHILAKAFEDDETKAQQAVEELLALA